MAYMKQHLEDELIQVSIEYPHQDTAFFIYLDNMGIPFDENWRDNISDFEESYAGYFDSRTDFTNNFLDSVGLLEASQYKDNPSIETLIRYFDVDTFGRDLMHDYWETDGHYFRSY